MIEERPTHAITVRVSYLEIYNESLFDLLSTLPYVGPSVTPMTIVENPQGVFIKGLSVHLTSQEEDAFSLLFEVRWSGPQVPSSLPFLSPFFPFVLLFLPPSYLLTYFDNQN